MNVVKKPRIIWHPDEIKALRKHLGMTQVEFARKLGCAPEVISTWENGHKHPIPVFSNIMLRIAEESKFSYEANNSTLLLA